MKKGLIIVIIILIFIVSYFVIKRQNTYELVLKGKDVINIYVGEEYIEQGVNAIDINGNDVSNKVIIDGNVLTNEVGSYTIKYSIDSFWKKNEIERIVNVLGEPFNDINFSLNGSNLLDVIMGEEFIDPLYIAKDNNGNDYSSLVKVRGEVNTMKVGTYEIEYTLKIGINEKKITRLINVIGEKYKVSLDNTDITNKDVTINIHSNINEFAYFVMPDKTEISMENVSFLVSENGIYNFELVDNNNRVEKILVEVKNIDKIKPTGVCEVYIENNISNFNIVSNDNVKVSHYVYNNSTYNGNFKINNVINSANVTLYDSASNINNITCNIIYAPIAGTGSIYDQYNSDTLKYWIYKNNRYYETRIWVKDAYSQFKTNIPDSFGTLMAPKDLVNHAISKYNYSNKGMVAINGSGFVSSQFDGSFISKISGYRNSSVTPIVIFDGKVIRNFANQELPSGYFSKKYKTYGMTKNGDFKYYNFVSSTDINGNTQVANQIINDGVKYTFGFTPVLVENYNAVASGSEKAARQAICQVDLNNYIVVNNSDAHFSELSKYMQNLGCKMAFNTDGGGSVAEYYKKNSNNIFTIRNTSRPIADIIYFIEK